MTSRRNALFQTFVRVGPKRVKPYTKSDSGSEFVQNRMQYVSKCYEVFHREQMMYVMFFRRFIMLSEACIVLADVFRFAPARSEELCR